MEVLLLPLQRRDLCASALCCVGGDATDEEEEKTLLDWNGIKIVETDCMLPIDRVKPYARNAKRFKLNRTTGEITNEKRSTRV